MAPSTVPFAEIPLFDISEETPETGAALVAAAAKYGFLWIVPSLADDAPAKEGYDFSPAIVDNIFDLSRKFFTEASMEEKQAAVFKDNKGYIAIHAESLDPELKYKGDAKQVFNLSAPVNGEWQQEVPATLRAKEDDLKDFCARCKRTSNRLFRLLALGLGISALDWLEKAHQAGSYQTTRLLHYPAPAGDSESQNSVPLAGAHSDYGSITMLFQRPSQPGLELLTPAGTWEPVPIFPPKYHSTTLPPILINIGDVLSYWTNGLLKSTVHRVIKPDIPQGESSGKDRYSIAVFFDPNGNIPLTHMPSAMVEERAEEFAAQGYCVGYGSGANAGGLKILTAGEFLRSRVEATLKARTL